MLEYWISGTKVIDVSFEVDIAVRMPNRLKGFLDSMAHYKLIKLMVELSK